MPKFGYSDIFGLEFENSIVIFEIILDNDKYIKTKVKIYGGSVNEIFKENVYQNKKHHASV